MTTAQSLFTQLYQTLQQPICLLLLQMLLIVLVSRLFGLLFVRFKQPAVIGEILAGIFLGVSVLGAVFPSFFHFIFPSSSFNTLEVLSKLGLAFFMFILGMELDLQELRSKAKSVIIISQSSIVVPFIFGVILAWFIFPYFQMPNIPFYVFAIFMGIALSITAFPVLARIVKAKALQKTALGTLALSAAAFADIMAWCILAVIVAIAKAASLLNASFIIFSAVIFILLMFKVVRPFLERIIARLRKAHYGDHNVVVISFIVLLLSAFIAELIGIHMLFGAFLAGIIIPNNDTLKHTLTAKLEDVSEVLLLPIFFAFTGLRLQIDLLNTPFLWAMSIIIIIIAMLGKFIGSALPAKALGMNWKDALSVGALMNTRGLMELVVLNIGYELKILSPELFAILVLMALATTVITSPLLSIIQYMFKGKNLKG